ncbi:MULTISPECIES: DUF6262 family protein [Mycobacteroides]|uniref:DUF6262 family protein n=1 Tax=Mycobacteroides TaxID=670516 RepID=UPI0005E5A8DA|nr:MULTISPECIES: DUF6262 family protein [Mycobacteroides]MBE5408416.1 hypothetical protein [Mycobacteroides abscessus]MBE5447963.1 hypothetical protein [Mycobacteroides abscessus]MBE5497459.1 hypothetical protein [Mycobacteroides abscessus]MEC4841359.1 DUF6262 family protein [Mycobacteroides chelonae]MEC4845601.1 DUF6262 family protein [Mycobacteroides chelonae]
MSACDRDARIARLAAAAAARSDAAESRARRALIKLENAGEPVTFVSVARAAAVSTSFLYQHPELRRVIEKRRTQAESRRRPDTQTASAASLRTKLHVALRRNRDLADEVAALRAENAALRSRLLELGRPHDRQRPSMAPTPSVIGDGRGSVST